jgi:hypothetical protein
VPAGSPSWRRRSARAFSKKKWALSQSLALRWTPQNAEVPNYGVGSRTLNQTRIPVDLRSRVIGASRVFTVSPVALAGIIGGGIATTIGLRPTMEVGAAGMILALLATPRRSVWRVQATAQSRQI